MEQKQSGCDFCNMIDDDEHGFFIEQNYLFYKEGKCGTEGILIAFCPMCGRSLGAYYES